MWIEINENEKCLILRSKSNTLYTEPSMLDLHYDKELCSITDITYLNKEDSSKVLLEKKGWNDKGLWEVKYFKWKEDL